MDLLQLTATPLTSETSNSTNIPIVLALFSTRANRLSPWATNATCSSQTLHLSSFNSHSRNWRCSALLQNPLLNRSCKRSPKTWNLLVKILSPNMEICLNVKRWLTASMTKLLLQNTPPIRATRFLHKWFPKPTKAQGPVRRRLKYRSSHHPKNRLKCKKAST